MNKKIIVVLVISLIIFMLSGLVVSASGTSLPSIKYGTVQSVSAEAAQDNVEFYFETNYEVAAGTQVYYAITNTGTDITSTSVLQAPGAESIASGVYNFETAGTSFIIRATTDNVEGGFAIGQEYNIFLYVDENGTYDFVYKLNFNTNPTENRIAVQMGDNAYESLNPNLMQFDVQNLESFGIADGDAVDIYTMMVLMDGTVPSEAVLKDLNQTTISSTELVTHKKFEGITYQASNGKISLSFDVDDYAKDVYFGEATSMIPYYANYYQLYVYVEKTGDSNTNSDKGSYLFSPKRSVVIYASVPFPTNTLTALVFDENLDPNYLDKSYFEIYTGDGTTFNTGEMTIDSVEIPTQSEGELYYSLIFRVSYAGHMEANKYAYIKVQDDTIRYTDAPVVTSQSTKSPIMKLFEEYVPVLRSVVDEGGNETVNIDFQTDWAGQLHYIVMAADTPENLYPTSAEIASQTFASGYLIKKGSSEVVFPDYPYATTSGSVGLTGLSPNTNYLVFTAMGFLSFYDTETISFPNPYKLDLTTVEGPALPTVEVSEVLKLYANKNDTTQITSNPIYYVPQTATDALTYTDKDGDWYLVEVDSKQRWINLGDTWKASTSTFTTNYYTNVYNTSGDFADMVTGAQLSSGTKVYYETVENTYWYNIYTNDGLKWIYNGVMVIESETVIIPTYMEEIILSGKSTLEGTTYYAIVPSDYSGTPSSADILNATATPLTGQIKSGSFSVPRYEGTTETAFTEKVPFTLEEQGGTLGQYKMYFLFEKTSGEPESQPNSTTIDTSSNHIKPVVDTGAAVYTIPNYGEAQVRNTSAIEGNEDGIATFKASGEGYLFLVKSSLASNLTRSGYSTTIAGYQSSKQASQYIYTTAGEAISIPVNGLQVGVYDVYSKNKSDELTLEPLANAVYVFDGTVQPAVDTNKMTNIKKGTHSYLEINFYGIIDSGGITQGNQLFSALTYDGTDLVYSESNQLEWSHDYETSTSKVKVNIADTVVEGGKTITGTFISSVSDVSAVPLTDSTVSIKVDDLAPSLQTGVIVTEGVASNISITNNGDAIGTFYLIHETVSVSTVSAIPTDATKVKSSVGVAIGETVEISSTGLIPGKYYAYFDPDYPEDAELISGRSSNYVQIMSKAAPAIDETISTRDIPSYSGIQVKSNGTDQTVTFNITEDGYLFLVKSDKSATINSATYETVLAQLQSAKEASAYVQGTSSAPIVIPVNGLNPGIYDVYAKNTNSVLTDLPLSSKVYVYDTGSVPSLNLTETPRIYEGFSHTLILVFDGIIDSSEMTLGSQLFETLTYDGIEILFSGTNQLTWQHDYLTETTKVKISIEETLLDEDKMIDGEFKSTVGNIGGTVIDIPAFGIEVEDITPYLEPGIGYLEGTVASIYVTNVSDVQGTFYLVHESLYPTDASSISSDPYKVRVSELTAPGAVAEVPIYGLMAGRYYLYYDPYSITSSNLFTERSTHFLTLNQYIEEDDDDDYYDVIIIEEIIEEEIIEEIIEDEPIVILPEDDLFIEEFTEEELEEQDTAIIEEFEELKEAIDIIDEETTPEEVTKNIEIFSDKLVDITNEEAADESLEIVTDILDSLSDTTEDLDLEEKEAFVDEITDFIESAGSVFDKTSEDVDKLQVAENIFDNLKDIIADVEEISESQEGNVAFVELNRQVVDLANKAIEEKGTFVIEEAEIVLEVDDLLASIEEVNVAVDRMEDKLEEIGIAQETVVLEKSITIDAPIEDAEGTKQVGFKKETMDKLSEVMDRTNIDFGTTQISVEKENMKDTEEDLFFIVKKAEVDVIQVDEGDEETTKVFVKEVSANWESKPVERFEKPIKVSYNVNEFGFAKATDAERKQLRVLVLDEETNQWESVGGIYDKKTGTVTVYRIHASKYTMVKNKKSYSDVDNSWAKDEINNLLGKGISNPAKEFKPDESLTREEFAAWISRAYGLKAKDVTEGFGDVDQSNPYYREISNAFEQGLILGKGDDEFAPDEVITREEMATLIARAITNYNDVKIPDYGKEKFSTMVDSAETSEWAVANVMLMVDMGLMESDENNEFNPDEPITKEAAAVIFDKLYN